jgi:hypothetical protein
MSQMDFEMARPRTENKGHMRSNETSANRATDYSPMVSTEPIIFWQTWWWWWEIMAVIICIASTSGLVVLLKSIDNTPLRQWLLPIQPNSLIAVLTTINRAALLAPAASCISQLKWRHFVSAPRRLTDLQAFDAASRGPWGSLLFLFQVSSPVKALVTVGFAFLTILTLGIDPSAQQLLAFPVQETEISDRSVLMGMATGYISKSTNAVTVNPGRHPPPSFSCQHCEYKGMDDMVWYCVLTCSSSQPPIYIPSV